jgi:hypothetical protein
MVEVLPNQIIPARLACHQEATEFYRFKIRKDRKLDSWRLHCQKVVSRYFRHWKDVSDTIIRDLAPINQSNIPEKPIKGVIRSDNPQTEIW